MLQKPTIRISDALYLYNFGEKDVSKIKESLTFPNPKYEQVRKYSRYRTTNVPPNLFYYTYRKVGSDYVLKIPLGYPLESILSDYSIIDERVSNKVDYPDFLLTLRDTQKEAFCNFDTFNKRNIAGAIQMPTGKGKSILGIQLASYYKEKTLVVVHKNDLVTGWKKDIDLCFGGKVKPGLIKASSWIIGKQITLATIQTLSRLSEVELDKLFNEFGFVILDEMHHCPSATFEVVSRFKSRYKLGLTATPERSDGLSHVLNLYFGSFCFTYKSDSSDKDIAPVQVYTVDVPYSFEPECIKKPGKSTYEYLQKPKIKGQVTTLISAIPYNERPKIPTSFLDSQVVDNNLNTYIRYILSEYNKGHSCLVFVSQTYQIDLLCSTLINEFNVDPTHIGKYYGLNKDSDNDLVLQRAESIRDFITIATYSKATEGTNVKQWEVMFLLSSIRSGKNVEQAVGRIRRRKEGKLDPVIVYDFRYPNVYSIKNHAFSRDKRYKSLGFTLTSLTPNKRGLFSKGFTF